jgi:spore germination protein
VTTPVTSAGGVTHIVQQGETLFEISLQYGVPVNTIAAANGIVDVNRIFLNQELIIP